MHIQGFTELANWIWDLWCQYGDDKTEFSYFGQQGWEPIRLNREEVQGKYKIIMRGNDQNTNPQVKMQKAQQILMAITNPVLLQTSVITPMQQAEGLAFFYQTLDIPNWQKYVNMQPQPPQPPPPNPAMLIKPDFKSLTDAEQGQVLSSMGVRPDAQGRHLNKMTEIQDIHHAQHVDNSKIGIDFAKLFDQPSNAGGNGGY
jgi:hypothetical protein